MATITLVEDDLLLAKSIMLWLRHGGHAVHHAPSAQAALDVLDDAPSDIIVLDMLLPGANGMQFLHVLQSHADLARIPVVVCSNAQGLAGYSLGNYGVRAMLDKSTLTRRSLLAAVQEVL